MKQFDAPYHIYGFRTIPNLGLGKYGFNICMDGEIVKKLLHGPKREPCYLIEMMWDNLGENSKNVGQIRFYKDTWFLTNITYPHGDCACFGLSGREREAAIKGCEVITYGPHNIDSPRSASAILATWLTWFDSISALLNLKTPFGVGR